MNKVHNSIVAFLGPSYPRFLAQKVLDADYRPPAKKGDIKHAAINGAKTIILIDAYLVYEYPPSPMEVYEVISQGVKVIGTASLGALRAVELRKHGMLGSGWVYENYLNRSIDSDDEVVTSLDSKTDKGTTLPLVRVRYAASKLIAEKKLSRVQAKNLIEYLRSIYFEKRTKACIKLAAQKCSLSNDIAERLLSEEFDIKAIDTLDCLHRLAHNKKNIKALGDPLQ